MPALVACTTASTPSLAGPCGPGLRVTGAGALASEPVPPAAVVEGARPDDDLAEAELASAAMAARAAPPEPRTSARRPAQGTPPRESAQLLGEGRDVGVVGDDRARRAARTSVLAAPAARALASTSSTSARTRSLCGTVTFSPS